MSPELVDTHAHIHFSAYAGRVDEVIKSAAEDGVNRIITIGVNTEDSRKAVDMASSYENVWASVGIHPHDAAESEQGMSYIRDLASRRKVVAIGECGLDYYKGYSDPTDQEKSMRAQLELAGELGKPIIFHVREAFDRFFQLLRDYPEVSGVVHSFTAGPHEMSAIVERGLHVALNGIMTFTKDQSQLEAARLVPLSHLLLETDCPFLSPAPDRGKTNEPAKIVPIAGFLAELRGESFNVLASATTSNSRRLFGI